MTGKARKEVSHCSHERRREEWKGRRTLALERTPPLWLRLRKVEHWRMGENHALNLVFPLRQLPLDPRESLNRRSRSLIRRRNEVDERLKEGIVRREGEHRIGEL